LHCRNVVSIDKFTVLRVAMPWSAGECFGSEERKCLYVTRKSRIGGVRVALYIDAALVCAKAELNDPRHIGCELVAKRFYV
jgi:hypothetical protein